MQNEIKIREAMPRKRNIATKILLTPEVSILIPLLILCVITGIVKPNFVKWANISSIIRYTAFYGVLSIGQAVVIMSGEIDLSVGSSAGFAGIVFGVAAVQWGWGPIPSVLLAMAAGAAVGFINGYLVSKFGLVNFISTLATMYLCRGLQTAFSGGAPVGPLPDYYSGIIEDQPLGLSWLFFMMLAILLITEFVIRFTTVGRKVMAVGGNKEAALMGGINVVKVKWGAYIFSGVMAAVCGILWALDMQSANHDAGIGGEFRTITACAVGGISLTGGVGTIIGTGIGVLLILVLQNSLQALAVESNLQLVFIGIILIAAVLVDLLRKRVASQNV
jgi:ribose transport system permease protein